MSRKVDCEVFNVTAVNDDGREVESVEANCTRCGHTTTSFGTAEASVKRCLALMREQCPKGENNFYKQDDDDD